MDLILQLNPIIQQIDMCLLNAITFYWSYVSKRIIHTSITPSCSGTRQLQTNRTIFYTRCTVRSDKHARFETSIVNDWFNIFFIKQYVKAADDTFSYLICFLNFVNWLISNYRSRKHGYFTN